MNEPNLMTNITYQRLLKELEKAREHASKRNIAIGIASGPESDWHDNAAYDFAHTQYDVAAVQLQTLQDKLHNVKIIEQRKETDKVGIGNIVVLEFIETGRQEKYTILGPDDYNTRKDWISYKSPFGENLLGGKVGEIMGKVKIIEILSGEIAI